MTLSLIICSRNRVRALERCIRSLDAKEISETDAELILVDNGSTDDTFKVMQSFAERCPFRVEVVQELRQGLAAARNAGLSKAGGEIIAFTDDDCYLASGYLITAKRALQAGEFHYCGGRILLYDPSDARYGCNEQEEFEIIPPYSFIPAGKIQGANLVVHKRVVDKIGWFDPMLGAGTAFRCEDIDYCARASMAGFVGAHVPELVVYHHHGRKPGWEIEKLKKENAYACGAYYMKFVLMRKWPYVKAWLVSARYSRGRQTLREIRGGFNYLFVRMRRTVSRRSQ